MKLNKRYYQVILVHLANLLLIDKNKIAQTLDKELKDNVLTFFYECNELDIRIQFKKKNLDMELNKK